RRSRRAAEIVITTNDVLAVLLFRVLAGMDLRLRVRVVATDVERDLEPGTTDLALRPSGAPQRSLRGRRLGTLAVGVFRSRADAGTGGAWVLAAPELRQRATTRWLRTVAVDAPGPVECDRILAMRDACVSGLGRAVLPIFLATNDPRLELVQQIDEGIPVWLF